MCPNKIIKSQETETAYSIFQCPYMVSRIFAYLKCKMTEKDVNAIYELYISINLKS